MSGFPTQLFLALVGATPLFTLAQATGTLDKPPDTHFDSQSGA
jgi:hypothetical protein